MSEPKLHHHLPKSYQKGFCRDDRLWVYDRVTDRFRRDRPRNVGAIRDDYTFDVGSGPDTSLESGLADIDSIGAQVSRKLRAGSGLTPTEHRSFAEYLAYFIVRVPAFSRWLHETETVRREAEARSSELQEVVDNSKSGPYEALDEGSRLLEDFLRRSTPHAVHQNYRLSFILDTAKKLRSTVFETNWVVAHSKAPEQFVTCDNPLFWGKEAFRFPLSFDCTLLMFHVVRGPYTISHAWMSTANVRFANTSTAKGCERVVIGRDEKFLRKVVEDSGIRGTCPPPLLRFWPKPT